MNLDQRLSDAARRIAAETDPPEVDLDAIRGQARANRRRTLALSAAAAAVAVIVAGTAVVNRDPSATPVRPADPVEILPPGDTGCAPQREDPVAAPTGTAITAAQQEWIDRLPVGGPPLTPWWHDGVLHVGDDEFQTPFPTTIEVAGGTLLIGNHEWDRQGNTLPGSEWALVKDGRLEPLPGGIVDAGLSVDGRIAWWDADSDPEVARLVALDVETRQELASLTMRITPRDKFDIDHSLLVVGVDEAGIAYLLDTSKDRPISIWNVRTDAVERTDLTWDDSKTRAEMCPPLGGLAVWPYENAYVSPDDTRVVFTGPAPGDASPDCCTTQLRVRPVGDIESVEPRTITTFELPEGIPMGTLWRAYSDRGIWGVWWESDQSVLLDAVIDGQSYLVRCSTTDGECERVFDLGPYTYPPSDQGVLYDPGWQSAWAFARSPITD